MPRLKWVPIYNRVWAIMIRTAISVLFSILLCCPGHSEAPGHLKNGELTVEDCLSVGLLHNPRVDTAVQRTIEARQRVAFRSGIRLPQVDFRTEALQYDWLPPNKERILGGGTRDVYSAVNLSLLLFSSGKAEASIDAATARFYASQQDLRRARQEVAFEIHRCYYNILRLDSVLASDDEAVRQMEHHLAVARKMNEIGKAARLDVLRSEVHLAEVSAARLLTRNQLDIARLELLNAMGIQDQGVELELAGDSAPAPHYASPDGFQKEAVKSNPDYLKAVYLRKAAELDVSGARAEFGPNLSFIANYNREGRDLPDIGNWFAGFAVSVPIYTGGMVGARVGEAKAVVEQQKLTTELVSQRLTLAVRSAVLATQDAANRLEATRKSVEQSEEALNIAQQKYGVGLGSAAEVIDTQVALARARTSHAQALYDGKVAVAALYFAIGRDPAVAGNAAPVEGKDNR